MKKSFFVATILIVAGIQIGNAQQPAAKAGPFVATMGPGTNNCADDKDCNETISMITNLDGSCVGNILYGRTEIPPHRYPPRKIKIVWTLVEDVQSPVKNDKYEFTAQGIVIKYATTKDFDQPGHVNGSLKKKFKWRSVNENRPNPPNGREFEYDAYVVHGRNLEPCKILDPKVVNKN